MNSTSTPSISIVVPVYKAEKYIHRCIDSILGQTFTDFELILVDDGSPDNSGKICDEYAAQDERIRVVHKANGGVASARQCGIDKATGEYTIHADPDDWVEPDMLESMYRTIKENDSDILITDFFYENKDTEEFYSKQSIQGLNQEEILKGILTNIHGALWNKLIKTSIYKDNNIGFVEEVDFCEDVLFWIRVLQVHSLKISYLPRAYYHYDLYSNENSIVKIKNNKASVKTEKFICNLEKFVPCKYKAVAMATALGQAFFESAHVNSYHSLINKYKDGIDETHFSRINKLLLKLSCHSRKMTFLLYEMKIRIHNFTRAFFRR